MLVMAEDTLNPIPLNLIKFMTLSMNPERDASLPILLLIACSLFMVSSSVSLASKASTLAKSILSFEVRIFPSKSELAILDMNFVRKSISSLAPSGSSGLFSLCLKKP